MPDADDDPFPLYDPAFEHDGCGVGFIADRRGRIRRDVVLHALAALTRLTHRGAPASLGAVDGCGILTSIPWPLFDREVGPRFGAGRIRALGMFFVARGEVETAIKLVDHVLRDAGAVAVWRPVKVDAAAVLPAQRATTPVVLQAIVALEAEATSADALLYRARLRVERLARRLALPLTVVSLSTTTVVYKALVPPDALDRFYLDLRDERFASPFAVFHQRFSTNTSANWALAQPFRSVAHNGEINTIAGNRLWMHSRLADRTSLSDFGRDRPISIAGSDSQTLDDAIELLCRHGYSLDHAVSRLVPPAWEDDPEMPDAVRSFYEHESLLSEPWDGPAALVFADGRQVGAALDRNGFRPLRVVSTAGELVAVASEVGVLPDDEHDIVDRRRLGPGEMIVVDLVRGCALRTPEIRHALAARRPYSEMVAACVTRLTDDETSSVSSVSSVVESLSHRQAAFGCSREEIDVILRPMAATGQEAVGSMGDDTPPAVLSTRPRVLSDFFRQRFAQVTNPPIDPYRESSLMSLRTTIGAHGSYLEDAAPRPRRVALRSPILLAHQLRTLETMQDLSPIRLSVTFAVAGGSAAFERALEDLVEGACRGVASGATLIVLTDRDLAAERAAVPMLLAASAVHHALVARGLRMRVSLVVETGDARDPHHVAALCAFGASGVFPYLGYETIAASAAAEHDDPKAACTRYRAALERGLRTIMSKMGVCAFAAYCGAQLFEALGLDRAVVDRFFPGTPSPIGGATIEDIAATAIERHKRAFAGVQPLGDYPGLHTYRAGGEYHATNPLVVKRLQRARDEGVDAYARFTEHVYGRPPAAIRDLLEFRCATTIDVADVEPVDSICRRFFASAMSVGALSPEAHRVIAVAMNRLGARSNGGEGGEEPERFARSPSGDWDGSRTKQVASARFGVTAAYLRSADELQIKIAQGSKPGEGGQLPAIKVVPHIARLRHAQPGTSLISPPVHHDIYSIEDLAQLIYDLRAVHPGARINVKLVASSGVGTVAAGVVKAGADAIQISGHDGGTGASPRASIKHVGLPWEIGLAEVQQVLTRAGLRDRVVLQVDGGLKTGRDVAIAAALGANEYGFGTAALVALGCVMARQCHINTCPVGIATQRDDLRARFVGTPDMLIRFLQLLAGELRTILAGLGLPRLDDLIGRADLLRPRPLAPSLTNIVPPSLLAPVRARSSVAVLQRTGSLAQSDAMLPDGTPLDAIGTERPLRVTCHIRNTDRAFGARIAGAIAARHGDRGLPDGSIEITATGSAGQSFGAFTVPGMRLILIGDANDYLGKSMHGGEIVVSLPSRSNGDGRQVIAGNTILYGATGGRVFIAGKAGERFAVRNSGATAVVEGVGDHACEYMTGGLVVVLGAVGRNFAAGMSGGAAYVYDRAERLATVCNPELVDIYQLDDHDRGLLRRLLIDHERLTGSETAARLLEDPSAWSAFRKVAPRIAERSDAHSLTDWKTDTLRPTLETDVTLPAPCTPALSDDSHDSLPS